MSPYLHPVQNKICIHYYNSPVGEIILGEFEGELVMADWKYRKMRESIDSRIKLNFKADFIVEKTPLLDATIKQLEEYFSGERTTFDVPIKFVGTDFQKSVWKALQNIPFGKTQSYLELSKNLGNVKAIRAVASANANAISILVPCHRIIGADGSLTGYAGGLIAKKKLLELENALDNSQLILF